MALYRNSVGQEVVLSDADIANRGGAGNLQRLGWNYVSESNKPTGGYNQQNPDHPTNQNTGSSSEPPPRDRNRDITDAINRELTGYLSAYGYQPSGGGELQPLVDKIRQSINFGDNFQQDVKDNTALIGAVASGYFQKKEQERIDAEKNKTQNPEVTQEHQNTASRVVQEVYGRNATQDEINFFAKEISAGESPFELIQFLKTTPEYQQIQSNAQNKQYKEEAAAAREGLNQELLSSESEAYKRALPEIMAAYQRAGKLDSSGVDNAIAKARADLERERQGFLSQAGYQDAVRASGYRREDFVGGQARAFDQYLRQNDPANQNRYALQNIYTGLQFQPSPGLSIGGGYASDRVNRTREVSDYERQQNDFFRALSEQRRQSREAALYGLAGSAISGAATGATYAMASDVRLKRDIQKIENALDKTMKLNGINFKWNDGSEQEHMGLLAQDVEKVAPEVVHQDGHGIKYVDYISLIGLLVEAIKELNGLNGEVKNHGIAI